MAEIYRKSSDSCTTAKNSGEDATATDGKCIVVFDAVGHGNVVHALKVKCFLFGRDGLFDRQRPVDVCLRSGDHLSDHPQSEEPRGGTVRAVTVRLTTFAGDRLGDAVEGVFLKGLHGRRLEERGELAGLEGQIGVEDVSSGHLGAFGDGDLDCGILGSGRLTDDRDELASGADASVDDGAGLEFGELSEGDVHETENDGDL